MARNAIKTFLLAGCVAWVGCSFLAKPVNHFPGEWVTIKAGKYTVGEDGNSMNPKRKVRILQDFEIATTEVTNVQFASFVNATGYITDAERYRHGMTSVLGMADWQWETDSNANWRRAFGHYAHHEEMHYPVTLVSYNDALAYCKWAGCRLPTLAEWEIAASAGSREKYPWGNEFSHEYANIWEGSDHSSHPGDDSSLYVSVVKRYPPNKWGLYDVIGNVFEYCEGGDIPISDSSMVFARGGSWWCSFSTCNFFNLRSVGTINRHAAFSNHGFRVVRD